MHRVTEVERAEMRLQQLCCVATSAPLVAPALYRELGTVLPFGTSMLLWLGPDGRPIDAYFNTPQVAETMPHYSQAYFARHESEVWATMAEAALTQTGPRLIHQVLRLPMAEYLRHPIYNDIFRPVGVLSFIRMLMCKDGRPVGAFNVGRAPGERAFDADDLQTMQRLAPFIVHALAPREAPAAQETVDAESATLLVDTSAHIVSMSASGASLMSMSHGSALAPAVLHPGVVEIVRRLGQLMQQARASASVPVWRTRNAWGRFTARAYWLAEAEPSLPAQIAIHIERRVPRVMRLLAGLHRLSLPRRQEQVAFGLALGHSEAQVARELGLRRNTVIHHRRQIYDRLAIDSRRGLVDSLSAASNSVDEV